MIAVDRGAEPRALREARWRRLAQALLAHAGGQPLPPADGYDVGGVRSGLMSAQRHRCVYCGRDIGGGDIEHLRPKAAVARAAPWVAQPPGYWWLTWTWENLFIACGPCNSGLKQARFPIVGPPLVGPASGRPLTARHFDTGAERGMVDPGREDPLDALRWEPVGLPPAARERWTWGLVAWPPHAPSAGGKLFLEALPLDKDNLVEQVTHWLRGGLLALYERAASAGPAGGAWAALGVSLAAGTVQCPAASWCALERWRTDDGGVLPPLARPGVLAATVPPRSGLPDAPFGVSWCSWLELLVGKREAALVELCSSAPQTKAALDRTLTGALGQSPSWLAEALRGARRAGRLQFDRRRGWTV